MNIINSAISTSNWNAFVQIMNSSIKPWSGVILSTSIVAVAGIAIYKITDKGTSDSEEALKKFEKIKDKVKQAYSYVFGGFALTAGFAVAAHITGLSRAILTNNYLYLGVFVGSLVSLSATHLTNVENKKLKQISWIAFNASMGILLSPLGYIQQKLVAQAAAISLGLGGVMTAAVFLAPDKKFLEWEGPLMACLTSITIASTIAIFFPSTAFAYAVDRVSLYGGLALFTGFFMASTQRLIQEAENAKEFDPIQASMGIYLDGLNIFVRVLRILIENQEKKDSPAIA